MSGFFYFQPGETMKLIQLLSITANEMKSEKYLRDTGIIKTFELCIKCNTKNLGLIRNDKWKCYSCKSEWSRRRESILSQSRLKYSEFIFCLKIFSLGLNEQICSQELSLGYKTANELYNNFRICISGIMNVDSYSGQKIIKGELPDLYVINKNGCFYIILNKEMNQEVLYILRIRRSRLSNSSTYYKVNRRFTTFFKNDLGRGQISESDKFWNYINENLSGFHSTSFRNLLLSLKEIEFRYNMKNKNIFNEIIYKIAETKGWS